MARESIPANPIDEQILSLRRQITNGINEMELIQEKHSAQVNSLEHTITSQANLINQLTAEKRELFTDLQSVLNGKRELEKEMEYLQEQLEIISQEKVALKEEILRKDQTIQERQSSTLELEEQERTLRCLREELEQCQEELKQSQVRLADNQRKDDRIRDLQAELDQLRLLQDLSKAPPSNPVLRLRDLQCRIESLSLAFRS